MYYEGMEYAFKDISDISSIVWVWSWPNLLKPEKAIIDVYIMSFLKGAEPAIVKRTLVS